MKYLRLVLLVIASAATLAHAQDEERQQRPPTEIPDFSNLDEYIYEPKSTVRLGFRHLSGAKTNFSGTGAIAALSDPSTGLGGHYYHDGAVRADTRKIPQVDSSGNPMIDPDTGRTITVPISPDGKTDTWSFIDQRQVDNAPLGFIAFHTYSANVTDTGIRSGSSRSTNGLDLTVSRDMGKLWNGRLLWNLVAGMSVNDISAKKLGRVPAKTHTITDLYSLNGQNAPAAGYSGPSTTQQGGDATVLLSQDPVLTNKDTPTTVAFTDANSPVLANWKVKGAYYTFRGGTELAWPITSKLRITLGAGVVIVYSGTTFTVVQTYTPDIGADIVTDEFDSVNRFRPGFYADATVSYDLTDKAGLFAGGVMQSAGSYTQALHTTDSQYVSKIDLSNQNGFRAGMSIRF